jgi:hypothetical protein
VLDVGECEQGEKQLLRDAHNMDDNWRVLFGVVKNKKVGYWGFACVDLRVLDFHRKFNCADA